MTFLLCDHPTTVRFAHLPAALLLTSLFLPLGCRAQQPATQTAATATDTAGNMLSPELRWKVEAMLREKANLPPETTVNVGSVTPSDFPGYDNVAVTVTHDGRASKPINLLLSRDRKTLAQVSRFDISADPKVFVPSANLPHRGGPESAPVVIVGFDDLECPYCARLHKEIFPALTQRYGDKVRIVYKNYPLSEIHPWALRAAIDTNCLSAQSNDAYWSAVDAIHAKASTIGRDPKDPKSDPTLPRAIEQLDKETRDQAEAHKLDMVKLNSCVAKQDSSSVDPTIAEGEHLGLNSTPVLFINGVKSDGAVSPEFLYGLIDQALRVAGVQPPPPYVAPQPAAPVPTTGR